MNWQELKAAIAAYIESFMESFQQQNQPVLRPIPIEQRRPEHRRQYPD